jgi:hypothetical protein
MRPDCVRSRISLRSPTTLPVSLRSKRSRRRSRRSGTARDVPFERSHDIDYLCDLIESAGLDLTPELKATVELTPWAVELRYADPYDVAPLDRTEALMTVIAVREWATEVIGAKEPAGPQLTSSSEDDTQTTGQ